MVLSTALAVVPAAAQDDDGDDGRGPLPGKDACAGLPMAPLAFPRDDRPHNDAHFEWWWWNGHLLTSKGDRYGFIVYFGSRPLLGYQWLDITLTDVRGRRFHVDRQPMILGAPPLREDALVLSADHASARAADGDHTLRFDLDGHQLKLDLKALKPATPYLGDGHMSYYCNQASFYARPRLSIRGTLSQHGRTAAVRGLGYFEHSWGHMPAIELANWNHVNLRLDDGRDLFVGTVRDRPGVEQFTYESVPSPAFTER
jgi:predicted secreted hydrolase